MTNLLIDANTNFEDAIEIEDITPIEERPWMVELTEETERFIPYLLVSVGTNGKHYADIEVVDNFVPHCWSFNEWLGEEELDRFFDAYDEA